MRIESGRPAKKGGWLHQIDAEPQTATPLAPREHVTDAEMRERWEAVALAAAKSGRAELPRLATELGVDTEALVRLQVGYATIQGKLCWTFPERNAKGWIIGIVRRLLSPADGRSKLCAKGSRHGLSYCDNWSQTPGAIWVVEGGSDVAAGLTLDLCVVGRPSNMGGIDLLCHLLRPHRGRPIVVCGEQDAKPPLYVAQLLPPHDPACRCCNRCWPGKHGAVHVARTLSNRLRRSVVCVMPPKGCKDLREYVQRVPPALRPQYTNTLRKGAFPVIL